MLNIALGRGAQMETTGMTTTPRPQHLHRQIDSARFRNRCEANECRAAMPREIVTLTVGQAGNQVRASCTCGKRGWGRAAVVQQRSARISPADRMAVLGSGRAGARTGTYLVATRAATSSWLPPATKAAPFFVSRLRAAIASGRLR